MTGMEKPTVVTDAGCEYWDDYYTKNTFEPGPNLLKQGVKPGYAHNTLLLNELDRDVAEYLRTRARSLITSAWLLWAACVHEKITLSA